MISRGVVAALLAIPTAAASQGAPTVVTRLGALRGTASDGVIAFKGIPYAAPPVGQLRWRPPQPAARWTGVRPADKVGALCEQKYNAGDPGVGPMPMSEDCLTLNVYAPAAAKRLPVMFWIHGGGFVNGSGTAALYDGSALARQNVIVVTINYRLGRFGFFAHPALSAQAHRAPVGNYGIMDMISALKWTRDNIAAFGGDPRKVTIFGESAGGAAVNHLMSSRQAHGLFARAIVESGLGRETMLPLAEAEREGAAFAASVHARSAEELRALSADSILGAGDPDITTGGGPMIDGRVITRRPMEAFRLGAEAKVPYMVGWNSLEFPVPAALASGKLTSGSHPLSTAALAAVKAAYATLDTYDLNLLSDAYFVEPATTLASLHARRGNPTWVYQFSVLPKSASVMFKGAPHALERQYVFDTLNTSTFPTDANDAVQARTMSAFWAAFGRRGNPNGALRTPWPAYRPGGQMLDFTNRGPVLTQIPRAAALAALASAQAK